MYKDKFAKLFGDIKDSWNNLGGIDIIDSFEKKWHQWDVDDTSRWFEFVLNSKGLVMNEDDRYDDYEIEDYSSDSSTKADEQKQEISISRQDLIDFNDVKSRLIMMGFRAKREFPVLLKPFQFEKFGFKNKQDCKLLCKKTKMLIEKHPRKKAKKMKQENKTPPKDCKAYLGLEGFVQDTTAT